MDNLPSIYAHQGEAAPVIPSAGATALDAQARTDAKEAERVKENTSFYDLIGAKMVQGPIAWAHRTYLEAGIEADPEFYGDALKPVQEEWREAGLESQMELLEGAVSLKDADLRKSFAMQNVQAMKDSGQFGIAANIGASLFDPSMFAIGVASGGLGYAAKAGRVANAVRAGLVGAAGNVGTEALIGQYDPAIDTGHLVTAGAFGFAMGGAFGFRSGELAEMAAQTNRIVKGVEASNTVGNSTDSMGAARVDGAHVPTMNAGTPEWEQAISDEAFADTSRGAFLNIRRDIAGRFRNSKSAELRSYSTKLVNDSTGNVNRDTVVPFSADEEAELLNNTIHGSYQRHVETEWHNYATAQGLRGDEARAAFNESVGYYMRGVAQDMAPEVTAVAKHAAAAIKKVNDELRAAGVPGFEHAFTDAAYLPRLFSARGYSHLTGELGLSFENLRVNLVKPAMRKMWVQNLPDGEEIDEAVLDAVSHAWLKRGSDRAFGGSGHGFGPLDAADAVSVRTMLEEAGVDAKKIKALLKTMQKSATGKAMHARAKSRIDLDESFTATLVDDLGNSHEVHLATLLENDVDKLVSAYTREMTGWAALKKRANIGTQAELDKTKAFLVKKSRDAGDSDMERALGITFNSILGRSTSDAPHSAWTRGSRLVRGQNFMTMMGQVGPTMIEGVGSTIGAVGLRNTLKAVPAAVNMVKRMARGDFSNQEAAWLADTMGRGTDFTRNQPFLMLDAVGESTWNSKTAIGRTLNKADRLMRYGQRYMSVLAGIAPMVQWLHGLTGVGYAGRLIQLANEEGLSASMTRRLRVGGLDAEGQARIFARLKGMKSVEEIAPNWHTWSPEDQRLMTLFIHRNSKRVLGEGNVGSSIQLMHSNTGKIFTQFRSFMTHSYSAVFLHGLHMRDWQTAQMWMGSTLFAGLAMAGRNYVNTIGDPEMREKLMTWDTVGKQAFQQSSYSSILPFMVDTIAHDMGVKKALGGDDTPVFAWGRSTGLSAGIMGNPTLSTANSAWSLLKLPATILDPHANVTEKQAKDAMHLLWFQNVTGVRNGVSAIARQFPKSDPTDD